MPSIRICCLAALSLAASAAVASAQSTWTDVYTCGASAGHSYFPNGDGWKADGMSKGVVILRKKADQYDLKIGDASGGVFSALEDGARVIAREEAGVIQVLVVYPTMTIETYLFSATSAGRSTLAWTSSKRSGIADRVSVFVSSCIRR